jgi:tropinone reductase I
MRNKNSDSEKKRTSMLLNQHPQLSASSILFRRRHHHPWTIGSVVVVVVATILSHIMMTLTLSTTATMFVTAHTGSPPDPQVVTTSAHHDSTSSSSPSPAAGTGWSLPSGTTAVVTGGTKGIGKAIVEGLASQHQHHQSHGVGCSVLTCSRNKEELDQCLEEWKSKGYNVHGVQADVSTKQGREILMDEIRQWLKQQQQQKGDDDDDDDDDTSSPLQLDILVNNVGTNIRKPSVEYTDDDIETIWNTNFHSMFDLTMKCYPLLKRSRTTTTTTSTSSTVINIGSVAGVTCMKSGTPYAATKAAMNQLTGNLACEWGPDLIRVNAVTPWYINTPLAQQVLKDESYRKSVLDVTPLGRVGEPDEVAGLCVFLCLPIAGWITGQVISVDGGFTRNGYYDSFYRG